MRFTIKNMQKMFFISRLARGFPEAAKEKRFKRLMPAFLKTGSGMALRGSEPPVADKAGTGKNQSKETKR